MAANATLCARRVGMSALLQRSFHATTTEPRAILSGKSVVVSLESRAQFRGKDGSQVGICTFGSKSTQRFFKSTSVASSTTVGDGAGQLDESLTADAPTQPPLSKPTLAKNQAFKRAPIPASSSSADNSSYPGLDFEPKGFPPESALHPELQEVIQTAAIDGKVATKDTAGSGAEIDTVPDFDDAAVSYAAFSTAELARAYMVLRACAIRPLVENSEALLKIGYGTIGENLTNRFLGKTFFAHFCAGETAPEVGSTARKLQSLGVGGILDYAAEVDLRPAAEKEAREAARKAAGDDRLLLEEPAECRTYDYMGEAACDARTLTFLTCVQAVRDQTPGGFAAVKLSALGDPVLLSQLTNCVHLVRGLFEDFDHDRDGTVSRKEFEAGYKKWFLSESTEERATLLGLMNHLDPDNTGGTDYVEWSNGMRLGNLAEITANRGPMAAAALDEDGVALKDAMQGRIQTLAKAAAGSEVRLMIDAEQSWLQPAIDNIVYSLQREFNKEFPTIYTTCQCYLKDSLERLSTDLHRAEREGYVWAGKLVRGAYMVSERERASAEGRDSPVFETIEDTHACYNAATTMVLEHMAKGDRTEVVIATHNQASIEHTIRSMQKLGIRRDSGVSFGQLLGMADNITFPLGTQGYQAYKYIPYGKVGETIPYLLRRAQENSGMLGGASHERSLLLKEMRRRISKPFSRASRQQSTLGRRMFSSSSRRSYAESSSEPGSNSPSDSDWSSPSAPKSDIIPNFSWLAGLLAYALYSSNKRDNEHPARKWSSDMTEERLHWQEEPMWKTSHPKLRRYPKTRINTRS